MKTIKRKCLVCAKNLKIGIYDDKQYHGGHYFNKFKLPIGKGEYKKTSKSKLFGKTVDVVKWTGKEKEIEYWECEKCYKQGEYEWWLETTIRKLYGKKCPDYESGCACCQAWSMLEIIQEHHREKL